MGDCIFLNMIGRCEQMLAKNVTHEIAQKFAKYFAGKWLWLSWQSGCFRYHWFAVQIQSLAKFLINLLTVSCWVDKNKEKEAGNGHLKTYLGYFCKHGCQELSEIGKSGHTDGGDVISVTRLGYSWKVWVTKYIFCNNSPNILKLLGHLRSVTVWIKHNVATLWATFGEHLATFYSFIWSHCRYDQPLASLS